ncbi:MAG: DUF308 domain-containing protein [Planctomycetes bacterium]|nr:DUF308 domain-containing protein [Planctomycetota bacterium]
MPMDPNETEPMPPEDALDFEEHTPRWSKLAILAVILGVIFLIPWPPLVAMRGSGIHKMPLAIAVGMGFAGVAVVLGIAGIIGTVRKRRRGLWLAIAGCTLGLLGIGTQYVFGGLLYLNVASFVKGKEAVYVLRSSTADRRAVSKKWYRSMASKRFKISVTTNGFEDWLEHIAAEEGQLQNIKLAQKKPIESLQSAIAVRMKGEFVNKMSPIEVHIGFDGDEPLVDDILVGKSSPLD